MKKYVIEKNAVANNIARIQDRAGNAAIYAVLKADGYGVGCVPMARLCAENGIDRFAVTDPAEALAIAKADIAYKEILMLTPLEDVNEILALINLKVTFTVSSGHDANQLRKLWLVNSERPKAHIKIDPGMGRRGFSPERLDEVCDLYRRFPEIEFAGIYSHLCCGCNSRQTKNQFDLFSSVLLGLESAGINPGIRHICASTGLFYHPEMAMDAVRIGSALFGRIAGAEEFGLHPTGHCVVPIEQVRDLKSGTSIGYAAGYRTHRNIRTATCPIGTHYGFGLARETGTQTVKGTIRDALSEIKSELTGRRKLFATIGGIQCPVLGAVGSETVIVDVSRIKCGRGDEASFDINPMLLSHMMTEYV